MQSKEKSTLRKIGSKRTESIYLIARGIEVGIASGLICVAYRYVLQIAESGLNSVLGYIKGSSVKTAVWLAVLAVLGVLVSLIVKWEPDAAGSGIPQTSGEIKGYFSLNWWKVIIAKFTGGATSVFAGLSLGREGPSVQLGGMAAKGCAVLTKADKTSQTRMIACGAGAGMSAAFNAPIAGAMFIFEEIHHSLDKSLLCMGIVATIVADFVSKIFFGLNPIFRYDAELLALKHYWILIIMGVLLGVCGAAYNVIMVKAQLLFKKAEKIPNPVKLAFVFVISGVVGLFMPQVLCGGHRMAELLINDRPELKMLLILLFAKFIFGVFSFASGAPGGTLYPLCILGAYIGAVCGEFSIGAFGIDESLRQEFIILGMAGLFASIVRAPLTGIILVFELTGDMQTLLPLAVVSLISYAVANIIGTAPFYAILFEKAVDGTEELKLNSKAAEKVLETFVIPIGSHLDGKKISDIDWGKHCLIVSIERNDVPVTPKGDTELKAGDIIVMMISQRHFSQDLNRVYEIINS
ncbi:MAG: ClC family H(+)/Cl(-) exchange transporter [Clostridia bacterium]|nr:ClC family H(+)/Cl(-) exchange transporter [Clostridia bacterium]